MRLLLGAGNANNGSNAGFGYTNTNNRCSNTNANYAVLLYQLYLGTDTLPHRTSYEVGK